MSKLLTVFGATGNQGGSVIKAVLADAQLSTEYKIRAITRDVSKPAAKELESQGVEVVSVGLPSNRGIEVQSLTLAQADLSKPDTVAAAVKDSHTVFAVTNFWEHLDAQKEIAQGKAVADASKAAGVKHLIWSSLLNVSKITDGRLTGVAHFDAKAQVEDYILEIGVPSTFVLPGLFMSGFFNMIRKGEDGSYAWAMPWNTKEAGKIPLFDPASDTGAYTHLVPMLITHQLTITTGKYVKIALKDASPSGKQILESEKYYTADEIITQWSEATGHSLNFVGIPADVFKSFLPAPVATELTENMLLLSDVGYFAGRELEEGNKQLADKLTTWREFAEANKDKW